MRHHLRVYYLDDIPTPYRLGVQRKIAKELAPGKLHIAYCARSEPGRSWELDFSGLDVEFLEGRQWNPPFQRNPFAYKWNPGVIKSLEKFSPDIVVLSGYAHSTMRRAARWCRRNNVPYGMVSETSCRSSHCSGWRWWLKRLLVGRMVRHMSFGLPTGREAGEYLHKLGDSNQPMYYFPNTPDISSIMAEAERASDPRVGNSLRQQLGMPQAGRIILFVGRFIEAKRPMDVIRAFRSMKEEAAQQSVLVMVGDGELRESLENEAAGDARIIFTGWLKEQQQIARLMAIASIMVLPSAHEPWGAVVNEAMAAGVAVIASDRVCAAIELIRNGKNGFVFSVGDVKELSGFMEHLVLDEQACIRMGNQARQTAVSHGHEFAAGNLMRALGDIAGG